MKIREEDIYYDHPCACCQRKGKLVGNGYHVRLDTAFFPEEDRLEVGLRIVKDVDIPGMSASQVATKEVAAVKEILSWLNAQG